ncbi:protein of unknown function [Nitrospira japonica]|uniref:Uncharacterized protein n=1 Tax=Nitrospira japonica TaxID=1325564 RepID=A0A1W1I4B5_9BACT|nr:protein of unknown function [Nitrospira japonica]
MRGHMGRLILTKARGNLQGKAWIPEWLGLEGGVLLGRNLVGWTADTG